MTLIGDYSPSGLQLMATLSDGSSTLSFTTNDPNPLQGTYFGYYDYASGLVNHAVYADVSYDNFSLTVPEPVLSGCSHLALPPWARVAFGGGRSG